MSVLLCRNLCQCCCVGLYVSVVCRILCQCCGVGFYVSVVV